MKSDNYSLGDNGFFLLTGGCISTATRFLLWGSSPMLASDLEYLLPILMEPEGFERDHELLGGLLVN